MARSTTVSVRVTGDVSRLNRSLRKGESRLGKFGRAAGRAGKMLAKGLAVGTAAVAVGSVKAFADFDAKMTESLAIMDDVSAAMREDMSDAARQVAKTTSFSAAEAAESYFFLASAGLDAKESIAALPQVAAFAQAGMFDMATATDLATDAQTALGLDSENTAQNLENLTRTTDVFVKANKLANASVEQFATAMTQKAGNALRNVNKDIEEGTATLAVFAKGGIKAERAGTILRATLDGLTEQARKNKKQFREFGVSVFDADGNMRNMADIVADLEGALRGMSTEQREAALAQLGFNKRSREGILALLGNSKLLRQWEKDLRDAGGTAQQVAEDQLDTFWKQLGLLKSQIIDVGIELGEKLTPILEDHVVPAVSKAAEFIGDLAEAFTGSGDAAGDTLDEYNLFRESTSETQTSVEKFANSVKRKFREIKTAVSEWWASVQPDLQAFWKELQDNWPTIQQIFRDLGVIVTDVAGIFGQELSNMSSTVGTETGKQDASLTDLIETLGELAAATKEVTGFISDRWAVLSAMLLPSHKRIMNALNAITDGGYGRMLTATEEFGAEFRRKFDIVWAKVKLNTLSAIQFLIREFFRWADVFLRTADKAFGWVPGLGSKLDRAREDFGVFRRSINREIAQVKKRIAMDVQLKGAHAAQKHLQEINRLIGTLPGFVNVKVSSEGAVGDGPGRGRAGSAVAWARKAMAAVPGRQYLTSTYRSPAKNASIGGAPNSYHMDVNNPAADIGGENLTAVYAYLQRHASPIRELLGPGDPGHSDHVHFAARGGIFDRPTLSVLGEASSNANREIATPEKLLRDIVKDEGRRGGVTINELVINTNTDDPREHAKQFREELRRLEEAQA